MPLTPVTCIHSSSIWMMSPWTDVGVVPAVLNDVRLELIAETSVWVVEYDETPWINVLPPVVMFPWVKDRNPSTVVSWASVTPLEDLLTVTFRNVVELVPPIVCDALPENVTVPSSGLNVAPLFVQSPWIMMFVGLVELPAAGSRSRVTARSSRSPTQATSSGVRTPTR